MPGTTANPGPAAIQFAHGPASIQAPGGLVGTVYGQGQGGAALAPTDIYRLGKQGVADPSTTGLGHNTHVDNFEGAPTVNAGE